MDCQTSSSGSSLPPATHLHPSQQGPSPSSLAHVQPCTTRASGTTLEVARPPRVPARRVNPPATLANPTEAPHKQTRSEDFAPPPTLYYPPAPAAALGSNGEPDNRNRWFSSSSKSWGNADDIAPSVSGQFVEVATTVRLIEANIPHDDGQRKCAICGYTNPYFLFVRPPTHRRTH